jgi:uncharacterized protein (TIGR00255 family)
MTGFGQADGADGRHAVTVTLRSVNHRYLELKVRLADEHRGSEAALLELLKADLARGRVDVVVEVQAVGERQVEVEVHRPVVMAAHAALEELVEGGLIAQKLTAGDLLRLPEALSVRVAPERWEEEDQDLLLAVAGRALEQLVAGRSHEGGRLHDALEKLLGQLAEVAAVLEEQARRLAPEAAEALRRRLQDLLAAAPSPSGLDPGRLEQEVALLAEKSDVREELDRLAAHLAHFRELLADGWAVGKRLDFLSQEILRELNTLGAKCRNAEMTRKVLEAKALCEQLREQVQNVE